MKSLFKITIILATIFFGAESFKYFFELQEIINSEVYNWRFYLLITSFLGSLFLSIAGLYGIYRVFSGKIKE
ncbi:hypothetical protein MWN41_02770 [Ornithobacterium rhinotracheale]|uniref:hypothetical protein n=1 Tax=Ornithobacterium rhinotracheale TaxID=28251 RepID=UPI001FF33B15|nr:hypothetical protein [Ornithobacterium rhinotracheale]MCK0201941.1 hypothetical protein [Ornithobacterium rhinotracheale]